MNDERALIEDTLNKLFPGQLTRLSIPWEPCDWSKSYKAEFANGNVFYIKGTPRHRVEAQTTSLLHSYEPQHIPKVLVQDLLPAQPWRWFLLEAVGECDQESITPACAIRAAFHLGALQRNVAHNRQLANMLPHCQADGLLEALNRICEWALPAFSGEKREEIIALHNQIKQATSFFQALQEQLDHLPTTCIHGDFWSGNIACQADNVAFIDWGDALWGVGSVSITNLLAAEAETLTAHADAVWQAYVQGWGKELSPAFIQSSTVAALVASLVVDMEIALCCGETADTLLSLFPLLRRLAELTA